MLSGDLSMPVCTSWYWWHSYDYKWLTSLESGWGMYRNLSSFIFFHLFFYIQNNFERKEKKKNLVGVKKRRRITKEMFLFTLQKTDYWREGTKQWSVRKVFAHSGRRRHDESYYVTRDHIYTLVRSTPWQCWFSYGSVDCACTLRSEVTTGCLPQSGLHCSFQEVSH